jgi:hypothetical protein
MAELPPNQEPVTFRPSPEVLEKLRAAELVEWIQETGEPTPEGLAWAEQAMSVTRTGRATS